MRRRRVGSHVVKEEQYDAIRHDLHVVSSLLRALRDQFAEHIESQTREPTVVINLNVQAADTPGVARALASALSSEWRVQT